ncbi:hypothetical protein AVEN_188243-1 [Araneus ventricosus]|uniref:DUF19 domain-containing protein n=1 Tax=Araneus ventricosus TaxID=182803 RepID=A0A4Y2IRM4_ARAVE|nr:hypothetical protein AVEN_188243-1 [Araneus ventricosus]
MESKFRTVVLCVLGLFVIVQALPSEPEDVAKYVKCVTYADCLSDGRQKIIECINNLKPEEVKAVYQTIQDYYEWKSNNFYDIVREYCKIDDAEKPNAYERTFAGIFTYQQKVCAVGSKKGECSRIKKLINVKELKPNEILNDFKWIIAP